MFLVAWSTPKHIFFEATSRPNNFLNSCFPILQVEDFVKAWVGCSLREVQSQCSGLGKKSCQVVGWIFRWMTWAACQKGSLHLPMKNRGVSWVYHLEWFRFQDAYCHILDGWNLNSSGWHIYIQVYQVYHLSDYLQPVLYIPFGGTINNNRALLPRQLAFGPGSSVPEAQKCRKISQASGNI